MDDRTDVELLTLAAKAAGMKYVVFTTKHHDGFCMFDTKQTDYSVMNSPFGKNPKANIANEVFKAFRAQDFMIGAYFSKPDCHGKCGGSSCRCWYLTQKCPRESHDRPG